MVAGIDGDFKQSRELFLQCSKLVKRKNNNLEKFCARRVRKYWIQIQSLLYSIFVDHGIDHYSFIVFNCIMRSGYNVILLST